MNLADCTSRVCVVVQIHAQCGGGMYPTNSCVKNKNVVYWDGGTPYYCWRPEGGVNVVNCADPVHGTTTWVNCCDQCHKDTNQNFEQQCSPYRDARCFYSSVLVIGAPNRMYIRKISIQWIMGSMR